MPARRLVSCDHLRLDHLRGRAQTDHFAHASRLRVEVRVTQEAPDKRGGFTLCNAHHDQAVASMGGAPLVESGVASKEGDVPAPAQAEL